MAVSKRNIRIKVTIPKDKNEELKIKVSKKNTTVSEYVCKLIIEDLDEKPV